MHPVVRKLSTFANFSQEEQSAIALALANVLVVEPKTNVAREDDPPISMFFLLDGFICRHKTLPGGERQILSFMLPGDPCDFGVTLLGRRDHSLTTMVPCTLARVSDAALEHLSAEYPKIRAALQWATLTEESVAREWLLNIGRRPALSRAAHLICETYLRLRAIGLVDGFNYQLPLSQQELGDALGISAVHTNRVLQDLRQKKLIAFGDHRMTILDLDALVAVAEFDAGYLHLDARYGERSSMQRK